MRARRGALFAATALLAAVGLIVGNASSASAAHGLALPKTYPSALTPAQIKTLSADPTSRVIIVFADQHPEIPGTVANLAARATALLGDQRPILDELATLHAPKVTHYSFMNAIAATVSPAEATRLASLPGVAAVVPDAQVASTPTATTSSSTTSAPSSAVRSSSTSPSANTIKPAVLPPGVCPSTSTPLLEPEALQLMNVPSSDLPDGAAGQGINGDGVKVAVFPDGLDPNIPDFIRTGGPDAGQSAIFDYQDFTGDGVNGVTGGDEAFGDASSLIAQGTETYSLNGEVNASDPLTPNCNIRIQGVAPGASVAVMKVFSTSFSFDSTILDGLQYAVETDHVNVLSQSFGGNPVPNDASDPLATFDDDAVAAGITVVASSGDAGITNTIGTAATSQDIISAGATTSYQIYAQTRSYGYDFSPSYADGWESDNVGSFSSSGDTDYGPNTIDVVAPGENGWADCSTNTAVFTECADTYNGPHPQPIEAFGGTSESCPLTAATAALVIEAYRNTHGGATPSPALVKQIIMSSAQNIDAPANDQGAGLVNVTRAIQDAESVHDSNGSPAATGTGLLLSPGQISGEGAPGSSVTQQVTVVNNSAVAQTVSAALRVLGSPSTLASGTLSLKQATDPTFIYQTGAVVGDVHTVTFSVPSGLNDLDSRIAWETDTQPSATIRETLFDPSGRIVSNSRPQGAGGGYGDDLVQDPQPGTWTLLVFETVPYTGPLTYTITGSAFHTISNGAVPASRVIPAGGTSYFEVITTTPSQPGDQPESLTFSSSANTGPALAEIPVVLRSTVPVSASRPGSFSGSLTDGNARMDFYGQDLPYQFQVPAGISQLNINVTVADPGFDIIGMLADPQHSPVDVQSTVYPDGSANGQTMHLSWHNPTAGLWSLIMTTLGGQSSLMTSVPVSGTVDFSNNPVSITGLPVTNSRLTAGTPVTANVTITNNGNAPEFYQIDPRLDTSSTYSLASLSDPDNQPLPIVNSADIPEFVLPPFSTSLTMAATSTEPISFTTSPDFGTPEILADSVGNSAVATVSRPDLPASVWSCPPNETGTALSVNTTVSCGATGTTATFDTTVSPSSGNAWSDLEGITGLFDPLVLEPGQSGTIQVTITPQGSAGTLVRGYLAVETFSEYTFSSDQVASIPYQYIIG